MTWPKYTPIVSLSLVFSRFPVRSERIDRSVNREGITDHFEKPMVAASIQIDSNLLDSLHQQIPAG